MRFPAAALLAGGAALSLLPSRPAQAQSSEPLRIGFLTVKTGPLAAGGKQQEEGAALFLKERNGSIAGRKVELIIQDTYGQPRAGEVEDARAGRTAQGPGHDRSAGDQ